MVFSRFQEVTKVLWEIRVRKGLDFAVESDERLAGVEAEQGAKELDGVIPPLTHLRNSRRVICLSFSTVVSYPRFTESMIAIITENVKLIRMTRGKNK